MDLISLYILLITSTKKNILGMRLLDIKLSPLLLQYENYNEATSQLHIFFAIF